MKKGPVWSRASVIETKGLVKEASDTAVHRITADVLDKYIPKWRSLCPKHITFRSDDFKLQTLEEFLEQPIDLSLLESLDVSCNSLKHLHAVEGTSEKLRNSGCLQGNIRFQSLRLLKVRKNQLTKFDAVLPCLRELDLAHNLFEKLPGVGGIPKVEALILAHNRIHDTLEPLSRLLNLKFLDLSDNRFQFKPTELVKELDHLAPLRLLSALRMQDNLFAQMLPEYHAVVLWRLSQIKILDNLTQKEMPDARAMAEQIKDFKYMSTYDDKALTRNKVLKAEHNAPQSSEDQVPVFEDLIEVVEDALEEHNDVYKEIKQMVRLSSRIFLLDSAKVDSIFRKMHGERDSGTEHEAIEAAINSYLENFIVFLGRVDTKQSHRVMLLRSLAKLSVVQAHSLGEKCIETLGFLLKRSATAEDEILTVVGEIIVEPLNARTLLDPITVPTVRALSKFDTPKMAKVLAPISAWLSKMYCNYGTTPQKDVTTLLAIATMEPNNTLEALNGDPTNAVGSVGQAATRSMVLPSQVMTALDNKQLSQNESLREQYIGHLRIVRNTSMVGDTIAGVYEAKELHKKLAKACSTFFGIGPVQASAQPGSANLSVDLYRLKNLDIRTCGALLDAITALMEQNRTVLQELVTTQSPDISIVDYLIIAPTALPAADPELLAASLRGLNVILKNFARENLQLRMQVVERIIQSLKQMIPLLEYIDSTSRRYAHLYQLAEQHLAEKTDALSKKRVGLAPNFSALLNPLMHNAFVAVVNLVEYFTKEGNNDKTCADVSEALNNAERERLLFKLLEVPSPAVKDAVMSCVKEVNMTEMSPEEAGFLVQLCGQVKDIAAERSLLEKVIGVLETLVNDKTGRGAGTALRTEYGEQLINNTATVLSTNSKVNCYGNKNEELAKLKLSRACVSLMQTGSLISELRGHLRNSTVSLCVIDALSCEGKYQAGFGDTAVECTWAGRSIETLLKCFGGVEQLKPTGRVALRTLSRIADVLEGCSDKSPEQEEEGDAQKRDALADECPMWDLSQMKQDLRIQSEEESDDREVQQQIFASFNGMSRLVHFLEGLFNAEQRTKARSKEVTANLRGMDFLRSVHAYAGIPLPQEWSALALADSTTPAASTVAPPASFAVAGRELRPGARGWIDLRMPPYRVKDDFVGALTISFAARWDLPLAAGGSWVVDFGNGSPNENIVISSHGTSTTLLFNIYRGSEGDVSSLVLPDGIQLGMSSGLSRYVFSVTADGQMSAFRDGVLLGRKAGVAPRPVQRKRLYVGKSHWSAKSGSFRGHIANLRVWNRVALDWDAASKAPQIEENEPDEENVDEDAEETHAQAQRRNRLFMKFLCSADATERKPKKQQLMGGLGLSAPSSLLAIREERIVKTEDGERVNAAHMVAALLRCAYAVLVLPASAAIGESMKETVLSPLIMAKLRSLMKLAGPFDCHLAAKFIRVMNSALEIHPSSTNQAHDVISTYAFVVDYCGTLCAPTSTAVTQTSSADLARRGRILAVEISTFLNTCCRGVPLCLPAEVEYKAEKKYIEMCLNTFFSDTLVNFIIEMVLHDPQALANKQLTEGHIQANTVQDLSLQNTICSLGRFCLAEFLQHCPQRKYEVLQVFSTRMVRGTVPMRRSFLAGLMREVSMREELDAVQAFLNGANGIPHTKPKGVILQKGYAGIEKVIFYLEVEAFLDGKPYPLSNPSMAPACLCCVITNRHVYLLDGTVSAHPHTPFIVEARNVVDITRIIRGKTPQLLHVAFAQSSGDATGLNGEVYINLVCHRETDRDSLLVTLHGLSEPDGGTPAHRALVQLDVSVADAVGKLINGDISLATFGKDANGKSLLFVLAKTTPDEAHFYELLADFTAWDPQQVTEIESEDERENESEALRAGCIVHSKDVKGPDCVAAHVRTALANKKGGKGDVEVVAAERSRILNNMASRDAKDAAASGWGAKAELLSQFSRARGLENLEKVAFLPDKLPKLLLIFKGNDKVTIEFFDDMAREEWRTRLMAYLSQFGAKNWKRSYGNTQQSPAVKDYK